MLCGSKALRRAGFFGAIALDIGGEVKSIGRVGSRKQYKTLNLGRGGRKATEFGTRRPVVESTRSDQSFQ